MALRLVRETSEAPNITNKDDSIMTRYAYGGYNGIVKGFGNECEYTAEAGVFKILDGRIVIDGWEIDIYGEGWTLNLSTVTGMQYHSVYAEISVDTESVKIDSRFLTGDFPEIDGGDDLTKVPNGTARLLLYNVKVENGTIKEVIKKFSLIEHTKNLIEQLDIRLKKQGFKKASVQNGKITLLGGWADAYYNPENSIVKSGVIAVAEKIYFSSYNNAVASIDTFGSLTSGDVTVKASTPFKIPTEFVPKETVILKGQLTAQGSQNVSGIPFPYSETVDIDITLNTDGSISIPETKIYQSSSSLKNLYFNESYPVILSIQIQHWYLQNPVEE